MIDERSDLTEERCVRAVIILANFAGMSVDDFLDRVFEDHDE